MSADGKEAHTGGDGLAGKPKRGKKKSNKKKVSLRPDVQKAKDNLPPILAEQHKLQHPWSFWFMDNPPPDSQSYRDLIVYLGTVRTVEEFWDMYTHLVRPTQLKGGGHFFMFKGFKVPMWENYANGGHWFICSNAKKENSNLIWERILFSLVGDELSDPHIAGAAINSHNPYFLMTIWSSVDLSRPQRHDAHRLLASLHRGSIKFKSIRERLVLEEDDINTPKNRRKRTASSKNKEKAGDAIPTS